MHYNTRKKSSEAISFNIATEIIDSMDSGLAIIDHDWRIIYVNRPLAKYLGSNPENITGQNIWKRFPQLVGTKHDTNYHKAMEKSRTQEYEAQDITGNRWYNFRVCPSKEGILVCCHDITESKRTEDVLRKKYDGIEYQVAFFDTILSNITDHVCVWNREQQCIYANQASQTLLGLMPNQHLGKTPTNLGFSSAMCNQITQMVSQAIETKQIIGGSIPYTSPAGVSGYYEYSCNPVSVKNDSIDFVICILREVTERKRMEDELRESQTKLEAALASMTDIMTITDAKGEFINFSDAFIKFFKFKDKASCPTNIAEYTNIIESFLLDGTPLSLDQWALPRALRGETVTNQQEITRRKDTGETSFWSYSFAPIRNKIGAIVGAVTVGRDITELKKLEDALRKSEERYRKYFELGLVGMDIQSPNGDWVEVNDRLCEIFGYTRDELMKLRWVDLTYPDDLEKNFENFQQLQQGAIGNYSFEKSYIRKDGKIINCLVSGSCSRLPNGEISDIYAIVVDITAQKQYEEALAKAKDELEDRVKERTAEISTVNERLRILFHRLVEVQEEERANIARELHDQIGQSLNIIKILLDRAAKYANNARFEDIISQASPLLAELIDRVSALSLDMRPKILDDLGLVQALKWYFDRFARQTKIQVKFEPSGIDKIDKYQKGQLAIGLYRVVQETLTNVARHAHATIVVVKLKAYKNTLKLSILDNGIGFDTERKGALLSGGIIGMQERIDMLGGTLQIRSKSGFGTRVNV